MSRIRGIETRIQKEVLQTRNGRNEIVKRNAEDQSSKSKDDLEKRQIADLLQKLPELDTIFEVHRKIGEGTFSSVYLGSLRQHAAVPSADRRWFAIKHLVPTAHPARIEHELRCLQDMGGKDHVIGVELCLRHLDTIVFIMPYIPHKKFSEYVGLMDAIELQRYMRALLTALKHVHSFGVIHRDVKPSNFLYDRENQKYLLVDFGLAQRICPAPPQRAPPPAHSNGLRKRQREEADVSPDAKRLALDLSIRSRAATAARAPAGVAGPAVAPAPTRIGPPSAKVSVPKCASMVPTGAGVSGVSGVSGGRGGRGVSGEACSCAGLGGVCGACAARPAPRAPRAGTQGFRPPEVLLKCPEQTTAVDMWAAGVVLASALTARYPFFRAADDVTALAELASLLGTEPLQKAAEALGRRLVVSHPRRGLCLRKLCARLRGRQRAGGAGSAGGEEVAGGAGAAEGAGVCSACCLRGAACVCLEDADKAAEWSPGRWWCGFPDAAFSLAARLLEPRPQRRLSAALALAHPFLTADYATVTASPDNATERCDTHSS